MALYKDIQKGPVAHHCKKIMKKLGIEGVYLIIVNISHNKTIVNILSNWKYVKENSQCNQERDQGIQFPLYFVECLEFQLEY